MRPSLLRLYTTMLVVAVLLLALPATRAEEATDATPAGPTSSPADKPAAEAVVSPADSNGAEQVDVEDIEDYFPRSTYAPEVEPTVVERTKTMPGKGTAAEKRKLREKKRKAAEAKSQDPEQMLGTVIVGVKKILDTQKAEGFMNTSVFVDHEIVKKAALELSDLITTHGNALAKLSTMDRSARVEATEQMGKRLQEQLADAQEGILQQQSRHEALMVSTQDLLAATTTPLGKGDRALKKYIDIRLKKGLLSSKANAMEMGDMQRRIRSQSWFFLTRREALTWLSAITLPVQLLARVRALLFRYGKLSRGVAYMSFPAELVLAVASSTIGVSLVASKAFIPFLSWMQLYVASTIVFMTITTQAWRVSRFHSALTRRNVPSLRDGKRD